MKQIIFTLTSARSGTLFLRDVFRRNIPDCDCRHEPFFDWGNPTLLGPAIYDGFAGRLEHLRRLLARKRAYIEKLPGRVYVECSHAFLKSAYLVALESFPELQLIHLIRNPLEVSKSEAYREEWRRRVHAPFHYYRGDDGRRHFYWSLTTNESIFQHFDLPRLSPFQRYLIQWIEIENRAMAFLNGYQLHERCFTLQVPSGLNEPATLKEMFQFFGLASINGVTLGRHRNKSLGRTTVITVRDEQESEEVLQALPGRHLEIFHLEPYASQGWSRRLRRGSGSARVGESCSGLPVAHGGATA